MKAKSRIKIYKVCYFRNRLQKADMALTLHSQKTAIIKFVFVNSKDPDFFGFSFQFDCFENVYTAA